MVEDWLPANRIAFVTSDSVTDAAIANYADTFRAELAADAPNGLLYAETLTIGLALHLLANYGVAKPKVPAPRGKLTSFQLRSVVDFIRSQLDTDVSLIALAECAHISPFHFARLFRATLGLPPHQFVLRLRLQRATRLITAGQLTLAQIAIECGFHDQPHFTRAFHRVFRMTPASTGTQVRRSPIEQVSTITALPNSATVSARSQRLWLAGCVIRAGTLFSFRTEGLIMKMKRILITGAGSGFGELAAIGLAKEGHDVIAGVQTGLRRLHSAGKSRRLA